MAIVTGPKRVWVASVGPYLFDDSSGVYADGTPHKAFRVTSVSGVEAFAVTDTELAITVDTGVPNPFDILWQSSVLTRLGVLYYDSSNDKGIILDGSLDETVNPVRGVGVKPWLDVIEEGLIPTPGSNDRARIYYEPVAGELRVRFSDASDELITASAGGGGPYIQTSFIDAVGDIISGSADDTPVILSVGADGYILQADSGEASGLKWNDFATGTWTFNNVATFESGIRIDQEAADLSGVVGYNTLYALASDGLLYVRDGVGVAKALALDEHSHTASDITDFDTAVAAKINTTFTNSGLWTFSNAIIADKGVRLEHEGTALTGVSGYSTLYAQAGANMRFRDGIGTIYTLLHDNSNLDGSKISSGTVALAYGGTGATSAADARTNLDVDQAGTDNSTNVTLAGIPNYITIVGQVITRGLVDVSTDVTAITNIPASWTWGDVASGTGIEIIPNTGIHVQNDVSGDTVVIQKDDITINGTSVSVNGHTHTESDITDLGNYSVVGHTHDVDTGLIGYNAISNTWVWGDVSSGTGIEIIPNTGIHVQNDVSGDTAVLSKDDLAFNTISIFTSLASASDLTTHISDVTNPHSVTASQAGAVPTARTISVAGTASEITSSAGAQDLSANRSWTLSLPAAIQKTDGSIKFVSGVDSTVWTQLADTILTINNTTSGDIAVLSKDDLTFNGTSVSVFGHTHTASDVTDFDTEVGNHTDVAANTTHRGVSSGNPHSVTPTELSLVIGTNVQAWDVNLDQVAGLATTDSNFIVGSGVGGWVVESGTTARTSLGVDAAGTDNSTNVTLAGSLDYITISGQIITRNAIDIATDVTNVTAIAAQWSWGTVASTTAIEVIPGTGIHVQNDLSGDTAALSKDDLAFNTVSIFTSLAAASHSHSAADITAGTFGTGAYVFDNTVSGITTLTASTLAGTLSTATQNSVTTMTALATVGTIGTGVWEGTAITSTYIGSHTHAATDITSGTLASARIAGSYTGITGVGTLAAGTWNGSVIASAYLDSDTAHLTTAQTFTGAKTFNAASTFIEYTTAATIGTPLVDSNRLVLRASYYSASPQELDTEFYVNMTSASPVGDALLTQAGVTFTFDFDTPDFLVGGSSVALQSAISDTIRDTQFQVNSGVTEHRQRDVTITSGVITAIGAWGSWIQISFV